MIMDKKIKITLVKSLIGRIPKHKTIAQQLGLTRIRASAVFNDTPAIRGMINAIYYLVAVEELTS